MQFADFRFTITRHFLKRDPPKETSPSGSTAEAVEKEGGESKSDGLEAKTGEMKLTHCPLGDAAVILNY